MKCLAVFIFIYFGNMLTYNQPGKLNLFFFPFWKTKKFQWTKIDVFFFQKNVKYNSHESK